jgi:hypothetical protein
MHWHSNYPIAGLVGVVVLLYSQSPAWAGVHRPVFLAPGFQFNQVDTLCVMPLIDARKDAQAINLDALRPVLMLKVQAKGYRLADPSCSRDANANSLQRTKSRWILTVRLDDLFVLTASLFDTESAKEVWRDSHAVLLIGRRYANDVFVVGNIYGPVASGIGAVLATFERQKNASPPSQANMWAPMSLSARLYKSHSFSECNGLLRFDSGTLSFDPSSNGKHQDKCASFQFSMPGSRIKTGPSLWMSVPGKGRLFLQQPGETQVLYLFLALRNLR